LTTQKVIFNPIGQFATDISFAHFDEVHLQLEVDINRTLDFAQTFLKDATSNSDMWVKERSMGMYRTLHEGAQTIRMQGAAAAVRLAETRLKIPQKSREDLNFGGRYRRAQPGTMDEDYHPHHRDRRFMETVLGLGASVIGIIWDVYKRREVGTIEEGLRNLEKAINTNMDNIKKLLHLTTAHTKILQQHAETQRTMARQLNLELNVNAFGTLLKMRTFLNLIEDQI
jgi:hypothetical protein